MDPLPKLLIIGGAMLIIAGVLWHAFPFGHLPGDIAIHKKNLSFYFPLGTSLLLSIILTIIFLVISLFKRLN